MSPLGTLASIAAAGVLSIAIAGCGSQGMRITTSAQVVSGTCESSGAGGRTVSESCQFVLSDGRRFRCHRELRGQPTASELHAAGWVKLTALVFSAAQRPGIAVVNNAR